MYKYIWDEETGGPLLKPEISKFSKEPRPVYSKELDILGFDKYWNYPKDNDEPIMWAEDSNYIYRGKVVAKLKGGSLYNAPQIEIVEEPETDGGFLRLVDIKGMISKNKLLLEAITQETIQEIYNNYNDFKSNVDLLYVAFSGGKDSVVVLDLVQRALPHNEFKVMFGDTEMEFPTTYKLVQNIKDLCRASEIEFIEAKAPMSSYETWSLFGPPARRERWCCTVHKSAPVINKLCELYGNKKLRVVMMTGVRGDESSARSKYEKISIGKKITGQISYHVILLWSSVEVYLYMYANNLLFNDAYKYGFNRVGCIMCPYSSTKHEYLKRSVFQKEVDRFCEIIVNTSKKDLSNGNDKVFLGSGAWKTRLSGRELKYNEDERFSFEEFSNNLVFRVQDLKNDWLEWYKTIGDMDNNDPFFSLEYNGVWRKCKKDIDGNTTTLTITNDRRTKNSIEFVSFFKSILAKSQYCVKCLACVAECPHRNISMSGDKIVIADNCIRCHACLKILSGCLYYNSVKGSKDMRSIKGINRYLSVGVDAEWIYKFIDDDKFEPGNRKTDTMHSFLSDAGITQKRKFTSFGVKIKEFGLDKESSWALIICNIVYAVPFNWYVRNIPFNALYTAEQLSIDLSDATQKARGEFWNGMKIIIDSNYYFKSIGIGIPDVNIKVNKNGNETKIMNSIRRESWDDPDPRVILYSLYKFAEACGGYYQFTLSTLLDDTIERDGVSPTRIFGLDRDVMEPLLNGLNVNYPDFITANFNLGLDTIDLNQDRTAEDVLDLF